MRGKRGIGGIWKGINLREIERFDVGVFFFFCGKEDIGTSM